MGKQGREQRTSSGTRIALWNILLILVLILGVVLLLAGIHRMMQQPQLTVSEPMIVTMVPWQGELEKTDEQRLDEYIAGMSLEEKVGQLFYVTIGNLEEPVYSDSTDYKELSGEAIQTLRRYRPGGVIFFSNNILSDEQVTALTQELQSSSDIPLYVGVDEEGGTVSRLGNQAGITMDNVGPMRAVGDTGDASIAYETGKTLAEGIQQYGFNMDFAPVADVLTNPNNTEIGNRSFGSDPAVVADMAANEIIGLQEQGVSAVAKHFPGHGGVVGDSHQSLQYIDSTEHELEQVEFVPFQAAIASDTDAILISHLVLTELEEDTPSSLSYKVVTELLRNSLGYDGLVITDSFQMNSIADNYEQGEAAVLAIQAGCDMILMPKEYEACYQAVLDAVQEGRLSETQIDEACRHILTAKVKRGILTL